MMDGEKPITTDWLVSIGFEEVVVKMVGAAMEKVERRQYVSPKSIGSPRMLVRYRQTLRDLGWFVESDDGEGSTMVQIPAPASRQSLVNLCAALFIPLNEVAS